MNKHLGLSNCLKRQVSIIKLCLLIVCCLLLINIVNAQTLKQTIQGKVYDNFTGIPLPGVNIVIIKDSSQVGSFTDNNGYFIVENLSLGKYTLIASFIGYKRKYALVFDILKETKPLHDNVARLFLECLADQQF